MKRLILLISLPLLFSIACKKQKPTQKLMVYNIEFSGKTLNITGSKMESMEGQDTVMAVNDTAAYEKALFTYYSKLIAENVTDNKVSTTKSFSLLDSNGISIDLDKHVTDSLNEKLKELSSVKKVLGLPYKAKYN